MRWRESVPVVLALATIAVGAIGVIFVLKFVNWGDLPKDSRSGDVVFELFKFLLTTVFVGGVALLYSTYQGAMSRDEENRRNLEQFFREVADSYNRIKLLRREVARAFVQTGHGDWRLNSDKYGIMMRELNAAQLELEKLRRISEASPAFLSFLPDISGPLGVSENYFRGVLREYEDRKLDDKGEDVTGIVPIHRIFQFSCPVTSKISDNSAWEEFIVPMDSVFQTLVRGIAAR